VVTETQNPILPKDVSVHLSRVIVPNFRVLQDIDITFEPDLVPRIFPLGSLNGGGKSTLLQLIFTLLYCCHKKRFKYLENMLDGSISNNLLAAIELIIGEERISLEFHGVDEVVVQNIESFSDFFDVCNYKDHKNVRCSLLCFHSGLTNEETFSCLDIVCERFFLAAPITQAFRFIAPETRDLIFKVNAIGEYHKLLGESRKELINFFAYDVVAADLLIKAFLKARDDDFRSAIGNGSYGNSYQQMLQDIEEMLGDKKVNIDPGFDGVTFFKQDSQNNTIKLYPEDLSHGELKRLSLFVWLKYNKIENSVVLIDEIEIALHPDWQYQIVRDLEAWAPSNQYILATHSYELCHALTPAHVKEISPRLLNK
jgi:hypothetical protein